MKRVFLIGMLVGFLVATIVPSPVVYVHRPELRSIIGITKCVHGRNWAMFVTTEFPYISPLYRGAVTVHYDVWKKSAFGPYVVFMDNGISIHLYEFE